MSQQFEEWLAYLAAQLPAPVEQAQAPDGSIFFTGGDPRQVIVRLTRSTVTVWEYAAGWEGPYTPVARPIRLGSVVWRRIPGERAITAAHALIDAARESRLSKFETCRHCERSTAPEFMHDDDVCQSCAAKHLGVVY